MPCAMCIVDIVVFAAVRFGSVLVLGKHRCLGSTGLAPQGESECLWQLCTRNAEACMEWVLGNMEDADFCNPLPAHAGAAKTRLQRSSAQPGFVAMQVHGFHIDKQVHLQCMSSKSPRYCLFATSQLLYWHPPAITAELGCAPLCRPWNCACNPGDCGVLPVSCICTAGSLQGPESLCAPQASDDTLCLCAPIKRKQRCGQAMAAWIMRQYGCLAAEIAWTLMGLHKTLLPLLRLQPLPQLLRLQVCLMIICNRIFYNNPLRQSWKAHGGNACAGALCSVLLSVPWILLQWCA